MRRTAAALALALLLPLPGLAGEVVVKPGETLSEIAERHGTTVDRLMQLNGLRSPQDLWAGSRIQVPGAGRGSGGGGGASGSGNYTVKTGETLSEIAERYGTTVDRLMQLNDLRSPQDLWAGSRIQVPGASVPNRTASASASPPVNRNAREHRVQPGETLSEIAALYGIPMSRLAALNGLSQPNNVQAGTTLKLRGTPTSTVPTRATNQPSRTNTTTAATTNASRPPAGTPKPSPTTAAARPTVTTPATQAARPGTTATTATTTRATPAATPPASTPRPSTTTAATATATARKPATPDWRSYGPLQVDWANWQPMAGSYVAPSLNSDGQPLYLAVNCSARRLNATGQSGTWKTWDAPQSDFEEQLISDLCKTKGS